jgi:hypothetical protein
LNVDGLGEVVERRPRQVAATAALVLAFGLLVGTVAFCTPSYYDRGQPPLLLRVDARGMPDWGAVGPSIALILLMSAGIAFLVVSAGRNRFRVDPQHEGVRLQRLGETRFVRYADVKAVGVEGSLLALVLRSKLAFRVNTGMRSIADVRELRDEILRRMETARYEEPSMAPPEHDDEPLLAPGGRSVDRWLSDLRAMAGDTGYRDAAMSPERLWHVLENRRASPAVRAGAAVVLLAGAGAARAHDRLHAIAAACEDNHLRIALDRIARQSEDDELRPALEPLCVAQSG